MRKPCLAPDRATLIALLSYNKQTGQFRWRKRSSSRTPAGSIAGCLQPNGYVTIRIAGILYQAHRLAWYYVTGEWLILDHKNLKRDDNRFSNLRPTSTQQNMWNKAKRKDNTSGHKGVGWCWQMNKWRARIRINGREIILGYFDDPADAGKAYAIASAKTHGEFSRT